MNTSSVLTWLLWMGVCSAALLSLGCEQEDDNKLASAQACLDRLNSSSPPSAAQGCMNMVSGLTSPQSYVIRCSVGFFLGGITPSVLINAYNNNKDQPSNLMGLALMSALTSSSLTQANQTYSDCVKSQVSSLIYMAGISRAGTAMSVGAGVPFTPGATVNTTTAVTMLNTCSNGGAGGVCNDVAIGQTAIAIYSSYCMGDTAQTQVCVDMGSAVQAGNNNPASIALALYQFLQ